MRLFKKRGLILAKVNKKFGIQSVHIHCDKDFWSVYVFYYDDKKFDSFDYWEHDGHCLQDALHDFNILIRKIK